MCSVCSDQTEWMHSLLQVCCIIMEKMTVCFLRCRDIKFITITTSYMYASFKKQMKETNKCRKSLNFPFILLGRSVSNVCELSKMLSFMDILKTDEIKPTFDLKYAITVCTHEMVLSARPLCKFSKRPFETTERNRHLYVYKGLMHTRVQIEPFSVGSRHICSDPPVTQEKLPYI